MNKNCETQWAEVTTLLAIPVGAYTFNKSCPNKAVAKVRPNGKYSRFCQKEMFMCQSCVDSCSKEVGKDAINIEYL